jgi:putative membrane protein
MRLLLRWLIAAGALWATLWLVAKFVDPHTRTAAGDRPLMMLIAVAVLGFANAVVRPVLKLLTLPLNCLTFGLFSFVINAALFWAAGHFTGAYEVGFLGALAGSIVMAIINGLASHLLVPEGER